MFEKIFKWILDGLLQGVKQIVDSIFTGLGASLDSVDKYLMGIKEFEPIIQTIAVAILLLSIFMIGSKYIFSPMVNSNEREGIMPSIFRIFASGLMIVYGKNTIVYLLSYVQKTYLMIMDLDIATGSQIMTNAGNLTILDLNPYWRVFQGVLGFLAAFILFLWVMWTYLKLMMVMVERYLILAGLVYMTPIAFSFYASQDTKDITKQYVRMIISQCVLLILTAFGIRVFSYSLSNMTEFSAAQIFFILAWGKVVFKFEDILNRLGLNVSPTADTAKSMGRTAMIFAHKLARTVGHKIGGLTHNGGQSNSVATGKGGALTKQEQGVAQANMSYKPVMNKNGTLSGVPNASAKHPIKTATKSQVAQRNSQAMAVEKYNDVMTKHTSGNGFNRSTGGYEQMSAKEMSTALNLGETLGDNVKFSDEAMARPIAYDVKSPDGSTETKWAMTTVAEVKHGNTWEQKMLCFSADDLAGQQMGSGMATANNYYDSNGIKGYEIYQTKESHKQEVENNNPSKHTELFSQLAGREKS